MNDNIQDNQNNQNNDTVSIENLIKNAEPRVVKYSLQEVNESSNNTPEIKNEE